MRNVKRILAAGALAVAFAVGACGSSPGSKAVAEYKALTDKMCACKTVECTKNTKQKARAAQKRWGEEVTNDKTSKQLMKLGVKMDKCMSKIEDDIKKAKKAAETEKKG